MSKYKISCNNCGKLNSDKKDYCYFCGKKLDKDSEKIKVGIKKKIIVGSILILFIIIISLVIFYIYNYSLNKDEKYVLSKIEYFKKNYLKYPNTADIQEILYCKNDNINERNIVLKLRAKNRNAEYITDYLYIHLIDGEIKLIASNYCYERLKESNNINTFKSDNDLTPYKNLKDVESSDFDWFSGKHWMGPEAKKDILDFQEGNELEDTFIKIRKNNILNNLN